MKRTILALVIAIGIGSSMAALAQPSAELNALEHKVAVLERKVAGMQHVINVLMARTGTTIKSTTHK